MISLLLFYKILQLLLIMGAGYALVRAKVVKSDDSIVLSKIALYLISPCIILYAFQVDFTEQVRSGILFSVAVAMVIHGILLVVNLFLKRVLAFDVVERMSILYSNAGNLIIPIVVSVLGPEWLIYSIAYMAIQIIFFWTHCKFQFCPQERLDLKGICTNINLLAIAAGVISLALGIHYPEPIKETLGMVGNMIGPVCPSLRG